MQMNKIKLFCFPYAGGSSAIFSKWRTILDENIELKPVELAGRGTRIQEPMYESVEEAVDDLFKIIKKELETENFAFYGHSMGAKLSYELALKLKEMNYKPPSHMFLSGRGAPHVRPVNKKDYHLLNDEKFKKKILELGGTPPDFFDQPELIELFLPLLRNDFKMAYSNQYERVVSPLDNDISVFLGKNEDLSSEQVCGWSDHTKGLCSIHYFNGGHFFINEEINKIVAIINQELRKISFSRSKVYFKS